MSEKKVCNSTKKYVNNIKKYVTAYGVCQIKPDFSDGGRFIEATFRHSSGPEAGRRIALQRVTPGARERRLLLSWAKAGRDSEGRSKATRSEGDDLEESAARALMRHGGRGRGGRG